VPDAILCKPDKLTDEEWEIMRLHTTNAYEWLRSIEYLQPAIDIPHYHHEKWDGTGYPSGLSGEEIPLSARIFAVVDVWDALSSDRYYRDAWPRDKVLHYIEDQAGKHFDPQVAEMFIQILAEEETNKKQELHH
jgi:HD-GYP domain-containing protein (c-di-GMP phosphodiesterase class II)